MPAAAASVKNAFAKMRMSLACGAHVSVPDAGSLTFRGFPLSTSAFVCAIFSDAFLKHGEISVDIFDCPLFVIRIVVFGSVSLDRFFGLSIYEIYFKTRQQREFMRPQKKRIVESAPHWQRYIPEGCPSSAEILLSLDMYEALRLVDAEGLPQGVAAHRMGVSTPTLCRLLNEARRRVASALRDGWALRCSGGNVELAPAEKRPGHRGHGCGRGGRGDGAGSRGHGGRPWPREYAEGGEDVR